VKPLSVEDGTKRLAVKRCECSQCEELRNSTNPEAREFVEALERWEAGVEDFNVGDRVGISDEFVTQWRTQRNGTVTSISKDSTLNIKWDHTSTIQRFSAERLKLIESKVGDNQ
jgi:hypothetical protein